MSLLLNSEVTSYAMYSLCAQPYFSGSVALINLDVALRLEQVGLLAMISLRGPWNSAILSSGALRIQMNALGFILWSGPRTIVYSSSAGRLFPCLTSVSTRIASSAVS